MKSTYKAVEVSAPGVLRVAERQVSEPGADLMIDLSRPFSRRRFLAGTSCFGAFYALAKLIPVPVLAADVAADARISEVPLVDKGFASVRKIGNGLYATISDPSKGTTTYCNGGFLVGRDAALLVEAFTTPAGASLMLPPAG